MEQQKDTAHGNLANKGQTSQQQRSSNPGRGSFSGDSKSGGKIDETVSALPNPSNLSLNTGKKHDNTIDYIVRKAEKLTTALYLVTDIVSDKDPIKWKAREVWVDVLSDTTLSSSLSASERMSTLRNVIKKIEKIVAFLDVAQSAHLISEMNSSVLKREYLTLKNNVESEWGRIYDQSRAMFSDSFFDIPHNLPPATPIATGNSAELDRVAIGENPIRQSPHQHVGQGFRSDNHDSTNTRSSQNNLGSVQTPKVPLPLTFEKKSSESLATSTMEQTKGQSLTGSSHMLMKPAEVRVLSVVPPVGIHGVNEENAYGREKSLHEQSRVGNIIDRNDREQNFLPGVGSERDDRRKVILALIKQRPALTVKDIVGNIPHVSEKTIQRELLSMVADGILHKRGERRWSTYSLRPS